MTDEQLLEEYSKEVFGKLYGPGENLTVARLIESHRTLRELSKKWHEAYFDSQKEGYEYGYNLGLKRAEENTIQWGDLRKMTVQELANLIGED